MADPKACSASEAAKWLPLTRQTIVKYIETHGAPCVQRADRAAGKEWLISVPDFARWLVDWESSRAVAEAVKKFSPTGDLDDLTNPGRMDIDEAKRRKAVADAIIREIELAKVAKQVVPIEDVLEIVSREYGAVRTALFNLGPGLASDLVHETDPAVIADIIRRAVDECMERMQADTKGISAADPDEIEDGDEGEEE
ncbi:terminase small subunit [Paracoccus beibuensis]|uniref:terminase small subunit n=1 Tax=Paracoccus beibuensis TaxID=547602 RepID=UPI00223E8EFA|nr:terminase small subunit [Paracoccus beibuensis]